MYPSWEEDFHQYLRERIFELQKELIKEFEQMSGEEWEDLPKEKEMAFDPNGNLSGKLSPREFYRKTMTADV